MSAPQDLAYSVAQCGRHLMWIPQEHSKQIMTLGPSERRPTSQVAACTMADSLRGWAASALGD